MLEDAPTPTQEHSMEVHTKASWTRPAGWRIRDSQGPPCSGDRHRRGGRPPPPAAQGGSKHWQPKPGSAPGAESLSFPLQGAFEAGLASQQREPQGSGTTWGAVEAPFHLE